MVIRQQGGGGAGGGDEPTRRVKQDRAKTWHDSETEQVDVPARETPTDSVTPTVMPGEPEAPVSRPSGDATMIYRGAAAEPAAEGVAPVASTPRGDPMADPPVGWLVVVDGPAKGTVLQVGYGHNSIGRDADQRITVVGDETISRKRHAVVTYDLKGQTFYVAHGEGDNLTYLDDKPLLQPTELKAFDRVSMGQSTLLFVPLCGQQFEWDQN